MMLKKQNLIAVLILLITVTIALGTSIKLFSQSRVNNFPMDEHRQNKIPNIQNTSSNPEWVTAGTLSGIGNNGSISVVSSDIVWVAGGTAGTPVVYRTTNGGNNWDAVPVTELGNFPLSCVWGIDANTAFVGNGGNTNYNQGNASFYKTTNGGTTWTVMGSTGGSFGYINGVVFSRQNISFGVAQSAPPNGPGTPYWLSVTTDGGVTWNLSSAPGVAGAQGSRNTLNVIDEIFYCFGLSGTSNVGLNRTTNSGSNWSAFTGILPGNFTTGLAMGSNKMNGIISTLASSVIIGRTTDGGTTWSTVNIGNDMSIGIECKWVPNTNICFIASDWPASSVMMKKSTDAGLTWANMTTAGAAGISHMDFINTGSAVYGYAISYFGNVIKYTESLVGITSQNNSVPDGFSLHQNYPNPFNPSTKISFVLPQANNVKLIVYDALGREVAVLVNEFRQAGQWSAEFNASALSSGIYFYRLEAGSFTETKKMLLIK
jgi:hypothetical protein